MQNKAVSATTQQRLGDSFYEQKLIREQIGQLTGRRFLDGYANDEAQYQALMQNAVDYARIVGACSTVKTNTQTITNTDGSTTQTNTAADSRGNNLAGTLTPVFDKAQVQRELAAQIQITQAFSAVAPKAVGDYAQHQIEGYTKTQSVKAMVEQILNDPNSTEEIKLQAQNMLNQANAVLNDPAQIAQYEHWKEGGDYRVALHAIVGGLSGGLEGALGAGSSAYTIPKIAEEVSKLDIPLELKQTLVMATGAAIGGAVGGAAGAGTALTETTNNCIAHDCLSKKWDKNAPGYHKYTLETPPLCNVSEAGCIAAVQDELKRYSAPGQSKPAEVGLQVDQGLTGGNPITQYMPNAYTLINGTGQSHIFNDGYIMREVTLDASGNVRILATGEGVNDPKSINFVTQAGNTNIPVSADVMADVNKTLGELLFTRIGDVNLLHIKAALFGKNHE